MKNKINIVAAFPGSGKTTMLKQGYRTLIDLDSALFPKEDPERFKHYLEAIQTHVAQGHGVLVSVHPELLEAMLSADLPFYLVYPKISLKEEYLQRYRDRNDWNAFLTQLEENWDDYIGGLMKLSMRVENVLELDSGVFLSDCIKYHPQTGFTQK